jgi:DNA mismatch repair protein MutS2
MNLHSTLYLEADFGGAPSLDLHGLRVHEALNELDPFLQQCSMANERVVTIVHGRGTGALRKAVHEHLKHSEIVESFQDSQNPHSQTGATHAILIPLQ